MSAPRPLRQQLLICWTQSADLGSRVVAWSFYDGASSAEAVDDLPEQPPVSSVLEAMRAGWRVLSVAPPRMSTPGHEFRTGFLHYEVVLERMQEQDAAEPIIPEVAHV